MGGFLIMIVSLLMVVLYSFTHSTQDANRTVQFLEKPGVQAVVANMIAYHQAAVDFLVKTENRNPVTGKWEFSALSPQAVYCSSSYAGGTYNTAGNAVSPDCAGGTSDFHLPSYLTPMHDWTVYYSSDGAGGSDDIVVTSLTSSSDTVDGYTSQQLLSAIADYDLGNGTVWFWGITPSSAPLTLSNYDTTINLPAGFTRTSVFALATIIP